MNDIKVIGLNLATHIFQVYGVNEAGKTVLQRTFKRGRALRLFVQCPPCLVGIEACGIRHY